MADRPLKDWQSADQIDAADMQAITDRLRAASAMVGGKNVRGQRGADGAAAFQVVEDSLIGKAVLVLINAHVSGSNSPYFPTGGTGGMYRGVIIKDVGRETVDSFVGDWYDSQDLAKPGSGEYARAMGGALWSTTTGYSTGTYDCVVVNLAEFSVLQSRMLSSSGGFPKAGLLWQGIVIGMTRHDDTAPSIPIVYIKGVDSWPCRVVIDAPYTDVDVTEPGYYTGGLLSGEYAPNSNTTIGEPQWGHGGGGFTPPYTNAFVVNLPERNFGGGTPWIDVTDPATGDAPMFLGHRVGYVTYRGSAVENFHVVFIEAVILRPGSAVTDLAALTSIGTAGAAYTGTEQGIINALLADVAALHTTVGELVGSLREANIIET